MSHASLSPDAYDLEKEQWNTSDRKELDSSITCTSAYLNSACEFAIK